MKGCIFQATHLEPLKLQGLATLPVLTNCQRGSRQSLGPSTRAERLSCLTLPPWRSADIPVRSEPLTRTMPGMSRRLSRVRTLLYSDVATDRNVRAPVAVARCSLYEKPGHQRLAGTDSPHLFAPCRWRWCAGPCWALKKTLRKLLTRSQCCVMVVM
jgi:hypothetical protein